MKWPYEIKKYSRKLRAEACTDNYIETAESYLRRLGEFAKPESYLDLDQDEILEWFTHLRKKGLNETSIKTVFGILKAFLRSLNKGRTPDSIHGLKMGKARSRVRSPSELITDEELELLCANLPFVWETVVRLIRATGGRPTEILSLRRRDVNFVREGGIEVVELTYEDTKTDESRTVPILRPDGEAALRRYLTSIPEDSDALLFPSPVHRGEPMKPDALWRQLNEAKKKAKIKKRVYGYNFRHAFYMKEGAKMGGPLRRAQMGHHSDMTKFYEHLDSADLRQWYIEHGGGREVVPEDVAERLEDRTRQLEKALKALVTLQLHWVEKHGDDEDATALADVGEGVLKALGGD